MTTFPVTLVLASNNNGATVAEFTVATTADVVAAHTELLRLASSISRYASDPREALPVQAEVNEVVLGEREFVTALGYTLAVKPEPVVEPEPEVDEAEDDEADSNDSRLSRIEAALSKFAAKFGVTL